ncbi:MAG: hypothetical protein WC994_11340, partial [Brumimicrobium sp.]
MRLRKWSEGSSDEYKRRTTALKLKFYLVMYKSTLLHKTLLSPCISFFYIHLSFACRGKYFII